MNSIEFVNERHVTRLEFARVNQGLRVVLECNDPSHSQGVAFWLYRSDVARLLRWLESPCEHPACLEKGGRCEGEINCPRPPSHA